MVPRNNSETTPGLLAFPLISAFFFGVFVFLLCPLTTNCTARTPGNAPRTNCSITDIIRVSQGILLFVARCFYPSVRRSAFVRLRIASSALAYRIITERQNIDRPHYSRFIFFFQIERHIEGFGATSNTPAAVLVGIIAAALVLPSQCGCEVQRRCGHSKHEISVI